MNETTRLYFRKFNLNDAKDMFNSWASDSDVTKFLTWNVHKNILETKQIINMWLNEKDSIRFAIVLKENNELIGSIDVVDMKDNVPEIGYVLAKKYWNHGYMKEALNAFVKHLFSLGYNEIFIKAMKENIASNKVILANKFLFIKEEQFMYEKFNNKLITCNCYLLKK